ncbi:MAG: tetratricopeptide repeat protein [Vicinamibacterales bacterium]
MRERALRTALSAAVVPILALPALSHAQGLDLRATVERRVASDDTSELAAQLALLEAQQKALADATSRLREHPDVKALQIAPERLDAYLSGVLEPSPESVSASPAGVARGSVVLKLDPSETARRVARLRKDQDATRALVGLLEQRRNLERRLAEQTGARQREQTVTDLRVTQLVTQVTVALARTEESAVSGRVVSADGIARAGQLADAAIALAPASAAAHLALGDVLVARRQLPAAETEYRQALTTAPTSDVVRVKLGSVLSLQQKHADAAAEFREALKIDPNSVRAHTSLGASLRAQRNPDAAMAAYRQALRLDPDFIEARNGLAVALAGQEKVAEAVVEFREIVRIDPDSAIGFYNLSFALAELDKDEESAAALREVIRINPNHFNARYNLGELFRMEGKFDEAAKQFREYVKLAPDNAQNRQNIARANEFVRTFENP